MTDSVVINITKVIQLFEGVSSDTVFTNPVFLQDLKEANVEHAVAYAASDITIKKGPVVFDEDKEQWFLWGTDTPVRWNKVWSVAHGRTLGKKEEWLKEFKSSQSNATQEPQASTLAGDNDSIVVTVKERKGGPDMAANDNPTPDDDKKKPETNDKKSGTLKDVLIVIGVLLIAGVLIMSNFGSSFFGPKLQQVTSQEEVKCPEGYECTPSTGSKQQQERVTRSTVQKKSVSNTPKRDVLAGVSDWDSDYRNILPREVRWRKARGPGAHHGKSCVGHIGEYIRIKDKLYYCK